MNERKNVYQLPAGDTTLEWYSKAVLEMQKKLSTDPRSWNYQAAMHGFDATSPYWQGSAPLPKKAEQQEFWDRCQHQSWFFLPWHRMYLAYFEQIVAQTIVDLGGPADWSLPFWDYSDASNPNASTIPAAFTNPDNATNGLWMTGRESTTIPERYVSLDALNTKPFIGGDGRTAPAGFGGPETTFSHFGRLSGKLEELPHNFVHGIIGGGSGAMGDPNTAALDPIFWLHHANIDRLWQVWMNMGNRVNPTKSSWVDFKFYFHDKDGKRVEGKCSEVEDTRNVLSGYTYEGVTPGAPTTNEVAIMETVDFSMPLEVIAATNKRVDLSSEKTVVHLKLTPPPNKKANLKAVNEAFTLPQTTILHFENITGKGVPPIHDVYLNVSEDSGNKESYYAGSISFFGLEGASTSSLHQSGSGQHYALDVSEHVNKLRSLPNLNEKLLDINIEPIRQMTANSYVKIGRISLYSE